MSEKVDRDEEIRRSKLYRGDPGFEIECEDQTEEDCFCPPDDIDQEN